jgi:hypothetical protein
MGKESLSMNDDLDNIAIDRDTSKKKEDVISALRQLTTAVTEMKEKLNEFMAKSDKLGKAGRF